MAYPDLGPGNRVLNDYFARHPVTPNAPAPESPGRVIGALTDTGTTLAPSMDAQTLAERSALREEPAAAPSAPPPSAPYVDADGVVVDPGNSVGNVIGNIAGSVGRGIGGAVDAVNASFRPDSASARSYAANSNSAPVAANPANSNSAPVIATTANSKRAPIAASEPMGPPSNLANDPVIAPDALRPRTAASGYDSASTQAQLDAANTRYRLDQAQKEQDWRQGLAFGDAATQRQIASHDLARAESEARVAGFRAANGADVVLAGGNPLATKRLQDAAATADANVLALRAKAGMPLPTGENGVAQNAAALAEQANRANTRADLAQNSVIGRDAERLKLEQQRRLTELGGALANAKDPAERQRLSETLLSLLGKDKPEEYTVIHAAGAQSIGPDGFTPIKGPDNVVVFNKRTGAREVLQLGQQAATQPRSAFESGKAYTDPVSKQTRRYLGKDGNGKDIWANP